jgi:hypothetical protein
VGGLTSAYSLSLSLHTGNSASLTTAGGLKLTNPGVSQGILFGGLSKQLGVQPPNNSNTACAQLNVPAVRRHNCFRVPTHEVCGAITERCRIADTCSPNVVQVYCVKSRPKCCLQRTAHLHGQQWCSGGDAGMASPQIIKCQGGCYNCSISPNQVSCYQLKTTRQFATARPHGLDSV